MSRLRFAGHICRMNPSSLTFRIFSYKPIGTRDKDFQTNVNCFAFSSGGNKSGEILQETSRKSAGMHTIRSGDGCCDTPKIATAASDVVQSGRSIFDDFSQHLWPYIGNNTANVVFQMVKRLWLIRIDQ
ncbi:hypothetical protein TNCV_3023691 [Trichonephila clavipes]|nr:hypothetical protein TNCV_3023691 [Trichonephila clavipes]